MNWRWEEWQALRPSVRDGRLTVRLERGLLLAVIALFLLSILLFAVLQILQPPYVPPNI